MARKCLNPREIWRITIGNNERAEIKKKIHSYTSFELFPACANCSSDFLRIFSGFFTQLRISEKIRRIYGKNSEKIRRNPEKIRKISQENFMHLSASFHYRFKTGDTSYHFKTLTACSTIQKKISRHFVYVYSILRRLIIDLWCLHCQLNSCNRL